ncbi:MAG: hypothetical protein KC492_00890 [Myxococcales bacterium]|nr:hypothetical protein [Myxococcales bacterium]
MLEAASVALAKVLATPIAGWDAITSLPSDVEGLIVLAHEVGVPLDMDAATDLFEQHSSVAQVVVAFAGD